MASRVALVISYLILTANTADWTSFSPTKEYIYNAQCKDWEGANQYCVESGGKLASAHLLAERTFIVNMIDESPGDSCTNWPNSGRGIWLGGGHNGTSSSNMETTSVLWLDDTVTPFTDIDWDSNEPNNYQGGNHKGIGLHYPRLKFHTTYLDDSGCACVCQRSIPTATPTETPTTGVPTTHPPTTFNPTALPTDVPTTTDPTRYPTIQPITVGPTTYSPTEAVTTVASPLTTASSTSQLTTSHNLSPMKAPRNSTPTTDNGDGLYVYITESGNAHSAEVQEDTTTEEPDRLDTTHPQKTPFYMTMWPWMQIGSALIILICILCILCILMILCCKCHKKVPVSNTTEMKVEPRSNMEPNKAPVHIGGATATHPVQPLTLLSSSKVMESSVQLQSDDESGEFDGVFPAENQTKGRNPNVLEDEFIVHSDGENDNHETMGRDESDPSIMEGGNTNQDTKYI